MHIEQLNDDILVLILDYCVLNSNKSFKTWKKGRPLLHISRRWRMLACPLVCKYVLIDAFNAYKNSRPKVVSNLGFVTMGYNHKHIRSLAISADASDGSLFFYQQVCKTMSRYGEWLSTTLAITTQSSFWEPACTSSDIDKITSQFRTLATMAMPRVTSLSLRTFSETSLSEHVHKTLIDAYRHQLTNVNVENMFKLSQPYNLDKLSSLHMDMFYSSSKYSIFSITVDSLVQLTLTDIRQNFPWRCLNNKSSPTPHIITFGSLRSLTISFKVGGNNQPECPTPDFTLRFPVLENLDLGNSKPENIIEQNSVFSQNLKSVKIKAPTERLDLFTQSRSVLPLPKKLILVINDIYPINEVQTTVSRYKSNVINNYLKKYHGLEETSLIHAVGYEFYPEYSSAKLANLSTIHVTQFGCMSMVIKIIEKAPALLYLYLSASSGFKPLGLDPEDYVDTLLIPFDTKLKILSVALNWGDNEAQRRYSADMSYMILRIPSLRRLYVGYFSLNDISAFAQKHMKRYPHLENIDIMKTY